MAAPAWITPPALGSFAEDYSFSLNPIVISFTAPTGTQLSRINGRLQPGLAWSRVGNTIEIKGESDGVVVSTTASITWRLTSPDGQVADRTYTITIVPVVSPPDWSLQDPDLGYATSGMTTTYRVRAYTTTGALITYGIAAFAPPTGLSINPNNGIITYDAPVVGADQTISFNVIATANGLYSTLACTIQLLSLPHAPVWITPAGLRQEVAEGQLAEVLLEVYEPTQQNVTFTLDSYGPSFPFTFYQNAGNLVINSNALVYGEPPLLYTDTYYSFTVTATSINGSTTRTFGILATPIEPGALLNWTNPTGELGFVHDGQYVTLDVSATSTRGPIQYSIVGGILPTHLVMERLQGLLIGYLEYQTRDREYLFDIRATDGFQTIERTFRMRVYRRTNYQFMSMSIPIEGPLKDAYYSYVGATVKSNWVPYGSSTPQQILYRPSIELISGLNYSIDDPAAAVGFANLHMHTTELMIGAASNVNTSPTTTMFYSPILDADAGAEYQYSPIGGPIVNASATVAIQTGNATFQTSPYSEYDLPIVNGTKVRVVKRGDPSKWVQGTVTLFTNSFMTVNVTATGGSGTYYLWDVYYAEQYPPSLENVRTDLIAGLGWVSDGQGSGATLIPILDLETGGIANVQVVSQGGGYLYSPEITAIGSGNAALMTANITIAGYTINHAGDGYVSGTSYTLSPPAISRAVITVGNVTPTGSIMDLVITYGGEYSRFPAGPYLLYDSNATAQASVTFSLGLGNISVLSQGFGYDAATVISVAGSELLPAWQDGWFPYLSLGTVYTIYGDDVVNRETPSVTDTLWYVRFPWQHAVLELQGVCWTGDTTFDDRETSFDGGYTFFAEWREPKNTIFEQQLTVFDQDNTYFDWNLLWGGVAYAAWGTTLFDENFTVFDLYSTTFDDANTPTRSITLLRKLLRVTTGQYSGHNIVV